MSEQELPQEWLEYKKTVHETIRKLEEQLAAAINTINWAREHRNSMDFYEQLEIRLAAIFLTK